MKIYAPILLFVISIFISLLIVKEYFYDMPQCSTSTDCKSCAKRGGCAWCLNKSKCVPTDRMGYPLYRDCLDKDLVSFESNCNRVSSSDMRTTTISTDDTGSTGNGNANWANRIFNYGNSSDIYGGIFNDQAVNLGLDSWKENNEMHYPTGSSDGDSWNKRGYYYGNKWYYNQDGSGNRYDQDGSGNDPYEGSDASGNKPDCSTRTNCKSCAALNDCAWCKDTNKCVETDRGKSVGNKCADMSLLAFVDNCPGYESDSRSGSDARSIFNSSYNSGYKWGDYISGNNLYDENGRDLSCLYNENGRSKITGLPCSNLDPAFQNRLSQYGMNDLDPSGNPWSSNNVPGNKFLKNADGKDVSCINNRHGTSKISGLPCRYLDPVSGKYVERFSLEKFSNYNPLNFMQELISEQLKRNGLPSKETFTGSIVETIRNAIRSK